MFKSFFRERNVARHNTENAESVILLESGSTKIAVYHCNQYDSFVQWDAASNLRSFRIYSGLCSASAKVCQSIDEVVGQLSVDFLADRYCSFYEAVEHTAKMVSELIQEVGEF